MILFEHICNSEHPEQIHELTLGDLAYLVLDHLKRVAPRSVNLTSLAIRNGSPLTNATHGRAVAKFPDQKSGQYQGELAHLRDMILLPVAEAWSLLTVHGLIAPEPLAAGNYFITRRGLAIQTREEFDAAIGEGDPAPVGQKKRRA